jgi:hypothetical protein
MMQDGLHVGLAAWINEQRRAGGFTVCPASPIPTALVDLEAIKDVHDLAKVAEFARLVNFVPRQGQPADAFSSSAMPLWAVHRNMLDRMEFATEPWTSAERAAYHAARATLYTHDASGRASPSQTLLLYEEMRKAYEDLESSGADQAELAQAMADWIVLGSKQAVEDAIGTILRLAGRSSRGQVQDERALLEPSRLLLSGDMPFASTYFAPISAIVRQTWLEATVGFDDLARAVGSGPDSGRWQAYRANRDGEVVFDYVVLTCLRPWYTPALYGADDWRLGDAGPIVSQGNGTDGVLPAYVDAVYLASVKNVTHRPRQRPFQQATPRGPRPIDVMPVEVLRPIAHPPTSPAGAGRGQGVVRKPLTPTPANPRRWSATLAAPPAAGPVLTADVEPAIAVRPGELRMLRAVAPEWRHTIVRDYLAGRNQSATRPPEEFPIHVTGFGCQRVPFAPNPNPNYGWSS